MLSYKAEQRVVDENSAFRLAVLSVIGDREDQQDSFGYTLRQNEGLIVVCDGMGGHEGGKRASELATELFLSRYAENPFPTPPGEEMVEIAEQADRAIAQLKDQNGDPLKAGSTLVAVLIDRKKLSWCSVGDSRAYLLREGEFVQLTQDHNYHTVLVEKQNAGLLDAAEFEKENARGEALISFLGIGNLALVDYAEAPLELKKDDKLVLMSDGLYKVLTDAEIGRILDNFNNIGEAVQALEMKAQKNAKGKDEPRDNMTVAVIKVK